MLVGMIKEQLFMKLLKLLTSVKTIITFVCITLSTQAISQETSSNKVADKTDWAIFVEDNPKECWSVSKPKETINTRDGRIVSVKRGDILLFVNFRPESKVNGQLSFTGGYPFAGGSNARSDEDDVEILKAMKKGAKAILTAKSSRGTKTQDTFSLLGFTAALEDAEKRCK